MGKAQVNKKIRQASRQQGKTVAVEVHKALLSIRQWRLRERLQFCRWLLWGRGKWGGVR